MKPIPQTIEAIDELSRRTGEHELLAELQESADHVQQIVPECIGMSVAWTDEDVTFTLVASEAEIAVFDALQYLEGGPCVQAIAERSGLETSHDSLMDEESWRLFAVATAAAGVRCTLTLPITGSGRVLGSINLYAAADQAFEGHHDELADALGAWAPGAIRNADLTFHTRELARRSPESLRGQGLLNRAIGMLAVREGIDVTMAEERLHAAAARAGITTVQLAEALLKLTG